MTRETTFIRFLLEVLVLGVLLGGGWLYALSLEAVDGGAAVSARAVEIVRRFRLSIGVFAGHLVLGLVGSWVASGLRHPTFLFLFLWLVVEVAALLLFTMAALLGRILVQFLGERKDVDLTV